MLLTPEIVPGLLAQGASARVDAKVAPLFKIGDRICVRNLNPTTHIRLPGYLRGKLGTIETDYGVFAFPDTHAHGLPEKPPALLQRALHRTRSVGPAGFRARYLAR